MLINRLLLFIVGFCVGTLFVQLHWPIPYMLGGMLTAIACKSFARKVEVTWPMRFREYALTAVGYGIGANFSQEAWQNILSQSVGVLEATASIFLASFVLSYLTAKLTGEDHKSCLMGMLPGGLTVMMVLSEEDKEVNPNIVAVMQVLRLVMVVVSVPFLVIYLLNAKVLTSSLTAPNLGGYHWVIFVPLAILGVFIARKLHFPTPTMLGPIFATALFAVVAGRVQPIPAWIMCPAQLCIGLYMGMQLDVERIMRTKKMIPYIVFATIVMIAISIGMSYVLSERYGFSLITAFLAMSPGGIAEMSLAGLSMGENVSVILTYQLVRILTMTMFVPYFLKHAFKRKTDLDV